MNRTRSATGRCSYTMLFTIVLEKVMRNAGVENRGGTLLYKIFHDLLCAHDVAIVARNKGELEDKNTQIEQSAQEVDLCVNLNQTKVMMMSRSQHAGSAVVLGEIPTEKVKTIQIPWLYYH